MPKRLMRDTAGPVSGGQTAQAPGGKAPSAGGDRATTAGAHVPPGHAARPAQAGAAEHGVAPVALRDDEAARRFIEDFASALTEMGVPRMPARVFVALVTSDSGRLTSAELGARLRASPAAMSGAVRYLVQLGLIRREGEPGSRRHYYRVPDDVWGELISLRNRAMARWTAVLREGLPILGADSPAGVRLAESVRFFEFVSAELPLVIARWHEHKAEIDGRPLPGGRPSR
jgi:predicted transcriptional regulator